MTAPCARLGFLTQGASGFTIRPAAAPCMRFAAVPLEIQRATDPARPPLCARCTRRKISAAASSTSTRLPSRHPRLSRSNAPRRQQQNGLPGQNRAERSSRVYRMSRTQQPGLQTVRSAANRSPGRQGLQQKSPGSPQQPGSPRCRTSGQPQQNHSARATRRRGAAPFADAKRTATAGQRRRPQQPGVADSAARRRTRRSTPAVPPQGQAAAGWPAAGRASARSGPDCKNRPALAPRRLPPPPKGGKLPSCCVRTRYACRRRAAILLPRPALAGERVG